MQYTKEMFRGMFQASFDDKQWQEMLVEYFQATNIRRIPEELDDDSDDYEGYYLGSMQTSDNIKLGFFTYNVHGSIDRRKVGLRQIVKPYLGLGVDAALVVFNDGNHWRLSLICDIKEEATAPKRFTYVFGDPQNYYNTPVSRFMELQDKGISFANIKEAFSVEALSDEFFKEYKRQYEGFVEYITGKRFVKRGEKWVEEKQRDPHPQMYADFGHNDKLVRDYVKKLLGRIVFLHFLQKKGWLGIPQDKTWGKGDIQFILHLYQKASDEQKEDFLDTVLEPLFTAIDSDRSANNDLYDTGVAMNGGSIVRIPYLNGGLFERDSLDEIPTKFPQKLFADLLDFFYQYNFTIDENDPNDAQVGVDPEMLGRIFENLLEDNKDKGAYYTPKEIVRYMCCQSLTAYLLTDISDETERKAIENFVKTYDVALLGGTDSALAKRVDQQLKDVKICDPAIGSGAFPMGLLRELFLCRGAIEDFNDAADIKRHIIQNNIYGVDIERGAVDIARLRFWLSLIVDEDTPASLPNLDYKIMQGNSLLEQYKGVDLSTLSKGKTENIGNHQSLTFFDDMVDVYRKELKQMIESYYSEPDHTKKKAMVKKIHENILAQMQEQSINVDLSNIDIQSNDQFFLWHTWFADVLNRPSPCNGFDIVIGNPPYGAKQGKEEKEFCKKHYITAKTIKSVQKGSTDTYTLFIEQAYNLLSKGGCMTMIVPIAITSSDSSSGVHHLLLQNCNDIKVSSYAVRPQPVFKNAVVNTSIISFRKTLAPCKSLQATKMYRKGKNFNLQTLVDNLQFVDVKDCLLFGRIPKISEAIEYRILLKISSLPKLGSFIREEGKPIYYRTTGGRYFKVVTDYTTGSTKETSVILDKKLANSIGCLLSSNLSFWFYQIYSNNLDWRTPEIESFPIPTLNDQTINELEQLYSEYLSDIERNANTRQTSGESSYKVSSFKEYKIGKSKLIIDRIDDLICPLYGLTQEETDFIKNYEIEFRLTDEE